MADKIDLLSKEASKIANEQLGTPNDYELFFFSNSVDHVFTEELEDEDEYGFPECYSELQGFIFQVQCPSGYMFVGVAGGGDMKTAKYGFVNFGE